MWETFILLCSPSSSSELVGSLREVVREIHGQLGGLVLVESVLGDPRGEEPAVHATRDVMPRGDREEGSRVDVETYGVVDPGGLRDMSPGVLHPFRAVEKPPRRAELERRVVAREGGKLARVRGLVQGEHNQG